VVLSRVFNVAGTWWYLSQCAQHSTGISAAHWSSDQNGYGGVSTIAMTWVVHAGVSSMEVNLWSSKQVVLGVVTTTAHNSDMLVPSGVLAIPLIYCTVLVVGNV
jgi:hypothetical protein